MYWPNLQSVLRSSALPVLEIIAIAVLGWVGTIPNLGLGMLPFERALVSSVPIGPP